MGLVALGVEPERRVNFITITLLDSPWLSKKLKKVVVRLRLFSSSFSYVVVEV